MTTQKMTYRSTRGEDAGEGYSDIVLTGLARDGGLYLPAHYPQIDAGTIFSWKNLSYADLAFEVMRRFADDIDPQKLRDLLRATYVPGRFCNGRPEDDATLITPVHWIDGGACGLLSLSNGPTLAFKDMAMQYLGGLFEMLLAERGAQLNILGATSGDTGSAAEYAMRGRRGIRVFMLSPEGRMSAFQRAQMYSLDDANIYNIAVRGAFDDAQDIVKAASSDARFKTECSIGTVNSINWARISAQVVYYFKGWLQAAARPDEIVDFSVPSGNFGDVLAGWIAKQMGLPVGQLVVATNENDVLYEFFTTGVYRVRDAAHTYVTSSPSMDISKASNFERYIYDIVGRDPGRVRALWSEVADKGGFALSPEEIAAVRASGFAAARSTHAGRVRTIAELCQREGVMIDPHTADGLNAARAHRREGVKMLVLETALAAKFAETIREATGVDPVEPEAYRGIEKRPQKVLVMDADVEAVKAFIRRTLQDCKA